MIATIYIQANFALATLTAILIGLALAEIL